MYYDSIYVRKSDPYFYVVKIFSRNFIYLLSPLMVKKQVYASLSTVTSITIVHFTIRYKNQYLDIQYFQLLPSTKSHAHFLQMKD